MGRDGYGGMLVRLHRHLVSAVVETAAGFSGVAGPTLERVVEGMLRAHPKWGSRDRRFFAEIGRAHV